MMIDLNNEYSYNLITNNAEIYFRGNLILNENPAPVTMENVDIFYTQALLNTTVPHSITNGPEERVLLKISIFDKTFNEVAQKINYKRVVGLTV